MSLEICQAGHPVLRQAARPLTREEILADSCQELIIQMQETMRQAPGVGLAAPQIGKDIQLAVIEDRREFTAKWSDEQRTTFQRKPVPFYVIINPEIEIEAPEDTALFYEGCLSVAGFGALVPRARRVRVTYLDSHAQPQTRVAEGWHARILQHEIDHLKGTLYLDRMLTRSFSSQTNLLEYWSGRPVETVCQELGLQELGLKA